MGKNIREKLFENYQSTHQAVIQSNWDDNCRFLQDYFKKNYLPILKTRIKTEIPVILEIGCNDGAGATALKLMFPQMDYTGVDLSPKSIELAKEKLSGPKMKFVCADSSSWCEAHPNKYDLIIFKAVMEHIPKCDLDHFLCSIRLAAKTNGEGGVILADVPNMDWILASHERYMDLTHECGYTCESLEQLFRNYFEMVDLYLGQNSYEYKKHARAHAMIQRFCRLIVGKLLIGAEPYLEPDRLWSRSIIAVGKSGANK